MAVAIAVAHAGDLTGGAVTLDRGKRHAEAAVGVCLALGHAGAAAVQVPDRPAQNDGVLVRPGGADDVPHHTGAVLGAGLARRLTGPHPGRADAAAAIDAGAAAVLALGVDCRSGDARQRRRGDQNPQSPCQLHVGILLVSLLTTRIRPVLRRSRLITARVSRTRTGFPP